MQRGMCSFSLTALMDGALSLILMRRPFESGMPITGAAFGKPLEGNTGFVWSVACTPDGQRTISGPNDKTNRV